jgi:hypothetical protein
LILSTTARYASTEGVMLLKAFAATQTVIEEVLGSVIAASISFTTTLVMGYKLLEEMKLQTEAMANEIRLQCAQGVQNA